MSVERYTAKGRTPYTFIAFGISLNIFILYILFPIEQLLKATEFFVAIFVILSLIGFYTNRKRNKATYAETEYNKKHVSPRDGFALARSYVWSNKYYILAATIGLILALTVIAQAMIVSSTFQQTAFNEYLDNDDPTAFRFEVYHLNQSNYDLWSADLAENMSNWFSRAGIKPIRSYSEVNIKFSIILSTDKDYNLDSRSRVADNFPVTTHGIVPELFNFYSLLPTFPNITPENESILILPPNIQVTSPIGAGTFYYPLDSFISSNETHNSFKILVNGPIISGLPSIDTPYSFHNYTQYVDRVWQLTEEDLAYIKYHGYVFPPGFTQGNLFLPPNDAWTLANNLTQAEIEDEQTPYVWGSVGFSSYVFVKLPKIVEMALEDQQLDLERSNNRLSAILSDFALQKESVDIKFTRSYFLSSPLLTQITQFTNGLEDLQKLILIFSFPLIIVSLFLLYFSTTSVENKKERIFSQLKIRGTSPGQIRGMILLEVLFSATIAALISVNLAVVLSSILMKSSGIFEFNNPSVELSYPAELVWRIPVLGVLISLSFNLVNMYKLPRVAIEDSMEANMQSTPLWVKHNIDLMVFLGAIGYWGAGYFLPLPYQTEQLVFASYGQYMLVILVMGIPLVTGRYFLQGLANILFKVKIPIDSLSIAIRNLTTNKDFTTKLVAVLTAAMMLTFTGMLMTDTLNARNHEMSLYAMGADIAVENLDYTNQTIIDALTIQGVEATTSLRHVVKVLDFVDIPEGENPADYPQYHIYGINSSTFSNAAYWRTRYASESLTNLVKELEDPSGLILPKSHADALGLKVGDTFEFRYGRLETTFFVFKLVGTVDYFPRLMDELPSFDEDGNVKLDKLFMITSIGTLGHLIENNLSGPRRLQVDKSITYVKTNGQHVRDIALEINSVLFGLAPTYEVHDFTEEKGTVFDILGDDTEVAEIQGQVTFLTLHSILIFTIIISFIGIGFYSFIFLARRSKEMGIYRALGMTRSQITKLIFFEISLIVFTSIGVGVISSMFVAQIIFRVILGNTDYVTPPFDLSYPNTELVILCSSLVILALLLSFIPAYNSTRKQTGNILRVV